MLNKAKMKWKRKIEQIYLNIDEASDLRIMNWEEENRKQEEEMVSPAWVSQSKCR